MKRIFYLTRSFPPDAGGGPLIRKHSVELLRESGFEVFVVAPGYAGTVKDDNIVRLGPVFPPARFGLMLERIGAFEDYLDLWVKKAFSFLCETVTSDDTVLATSGGELSAIALGWRLKRHCGCRFVINLHDPVDYTIVNGLRLNDRFHVARDKAEERYFFAADALITSSANNMRWLKKKYPAISERIVNNYFGYLTDCRPEPKSTVENGLHIVYGGAFSGAQSPEILARACADMKDVSVTFIGDCLAYKPLDEYRDRYNFVSYLDNAGYLEFLKHKATVGFVPLCGDYFQACFPSKIFDYINAGLPMLGALPYGDALEVINKGYGIACHYTDIDGISAAVAAMRQPETLARFRANIMRDRKSWSMHSRIQEILPLL